MNIFIDLFLTFSRVGVLTFGGGYAMLPILQREVVETKNWVTDEELVDYFAIGQTTPGIIAVNTSTFIGQKLRGTLGGIVATLGFVFPSYIIVTLISYFMRNFSELPIIQNAFAGIRVSVYVLILNAVLKLWKNSVVDKIALLIFILIFTLSVFTSLSPVLFVILAGFIGVAAKLQERRHQQK
ncbi:chromate transporter [Tetragenococcus muriaticus]|uniref:Chromate transporter n=2 Tax=Tetragenococcus muriaticus TaxID=64642 RepID=A0A091C008_9ENTE|nr:chromate transporter [Tetragenococcus muriaticus]KFN90294.1 chromate transporter [Tetragenococcus muriaticus 3MR10-3]KFN90661.1 chromate transporter [Tetragenococcus muriaticus PMC-11-5]GMA46745.1 chromate transporter [Tetragenococcus muriaticus]